MSEKPQRRGRVALALLVFGGGIFFAAARQARETAVTIPGIALGLAPWAPEGEPALPATAAAEAVMTELARVEANVRSTRCRSEIQIDETLGIYDWDASGMVGWILERSAPVAFGAFGQERLVAAEIAQRIHEAPTDDEQDGWRRITHVSAVRPGDVVAWELPPNLREDFMTGHTGIVVSAPRRVPGLDEAYSIEIADSTTHFHQLDSRMLALDFDGGTGRGTMTFAVDADGATYAYGWQGPWSPVFRRNAVEFGRVTR